MYLKLQLTSSITYLQHANAVCMLFIETIITSTQHVSILITDFRKRSGNG